MSPTRFLSRALLLIPATILAAGIFGTWERNEAPAAAPARDVLVSLPDTTGAWTAFPPLHVFPTPPGIPQRLTIPAAGIDAAIEPVGLTSANDMDVPKNEWDAGWYEFGPKPGEPGNAVIAGHLDSKTGPAVFWHLKNVKPGDELSVSDSLGRTRTFLVQETKSYGDANPPLDLIFGPSPSPRLNLITCGGSWDPEAHRYRDRLVVFAGLKE
jgi:sortase (surface protein transpeptidase)